MRRPWILPVTGAVLVGTATILGLILFRIQGFFELRLPELYVWSIVVGTMTVAFLGLVFVQMTGPSVTRRTAFILFGVFGAVCGLVAGILYGVFGIREACVSTGIDPECGWSVLGFGLVRSSFWPTFGFVVAIGVTVGAATGVTIAWLTRRSCTLVAAMPGN
jgi:hypothetical protein